MQPFDALTLKAVLHEARPVLVNRRIDRIQQISRDEVAIALRSKAGTSHLLVSAQASFGRLCLVHTPPQAKSPNVPVFCQLLRKYLSGAILTDMQQLSGERVVDLKFNCTDELGNRATRILTAEIMGRHSNLILWDEASEKILAASHNVTQEMSRHREIAPGLRYCRPPRQEKPNVFSVSQEEFKKMFASARSDAGIETVEQWLISSFSGLGRHLCDEVVRAAELEYAAGSEHVAGSERAAELEQGGHLQFGNNRAANFLWNHIADIQVRTEYKPAMRKDLMRYTVLSWQKEALLEKAKAPANEAQIRSEEDSLPPNEVRVLPSKEAPVSTNDQVSVEWTSFLSANDMVEAYFKGVQLRAEIQQLKDRIKSELKNEQDKLQSRIDIADKLLVAAHDHERFKHFGDLILANVQVIETGQEKLQCENLFADQSCFANEGDSISIVLNPNLSSSQNAQNYYRQYAKSRVRIKAATVSQQEALEKLKNVMDQYKALEQAETLSDLQILKERILDRGKKLEQAPRQNHSNSKNKTTAPRLLSIKSSDGLTIIIGRNRYENDVLVGKLAQPHDIWMHAQGLEGAHVLVKVYGKKDPPLSTIVEAAQVAARFSRSGLGGKIKVAYTYAKYVRKLGKDKPGLVRYENEKTIEVDTAAPMPPALRKLFS
jgi:predicted ribosome quality control (RQC) complex YloA/Tae2 family protein